MSQNSADPRGPVAPAAGLAGFPTLLLERGLIAPGDLSTAQVRATRERIELADAVVKLGVSEQDSYATLAAAAGAEVIALGDVRSSELAVRLVPERLARRHSIVPLEVDNRVLTYATCRPFNVEGENDLGFAAGRRAALKVATRTSVVAALDLCYPKGHSQELPADRSRRGSDSSARGITPPEADAPAVIEMCHQIIARALKAGAADVQIEQGANGLMIRYRSASGFEAVPHVTPEALPRISERFKIMARMATAVRNRSQNGAFQVTVNGRVADVRVSTQPTPHAETILIRIIDPASAAAASAATAPVTRPGRLRVLVTDDEPITRMLVKVLLERDRYDVLEATNGQQAIEIAVRERPNLVLIDLNMPVMDGYEAISALRREFPTSALPIIVLTAEEGDSVERRVLELGADDYLVKPFEPAVLMARVNAVFHRLNVVAG